MKISDVLLATMLVSAFGSQAQDSTAIKRPEILPISQNITSADSTQIAEISMIVKHIDSLYNTRDTKDSAWQKKMNPPKRRPSYNCPGCGRG